MQRNCQVSMILEEMKVWSTPFEMKPNILLLFRGWKKFVSSEVAHNDHTSFGLRSMCATPSSKLIPWLAKRGFAYIFFQISQLLRFQAWPVIHLWTMLDLVKFIYGFNYLKRDIVTHLSKFRITILQWMYGNIYISNDFNLFPMYIFRTFLYNLVCDEAS